MSAFRCCDVLFCVTVPRFAQWNNDVRDAGACALGQGLKVTATLHWLNLVSYRRFFYFSLSLVFVLAAPVELGYSALKGVTAPLFAVEKQYRRHRCLWVGGGSESEQQLGVSRTCELRLKNCRSAHVLCRGAEVLCCHTAHVSNNHACFAAQQPHFRCRRSSAR